MPIRVVFQLTQHTLDKVRSQTSLFFIKKSDNSEDVALLLYGRLCDSCTSLVSVVCDFLTRFAEDTTASV